MYRYTAVLLLLWSMVATLTVAKPQSRIVGGQDARLGQFPYQVALHHSGRFTCGGAIIASHWILTAAHCVRTDHNPGKYSIVAGAVRLHGDGQSYQVDRVIEYGAFSRSVYPNDVALLRTSKDIAFNANCQPIAFDGPIVGGHQPAVVTGWGRTGWTKPNAEVLQFLNTTTITNAECRKRTHSDSIDNSVICTLWGSAGHGSCKGDAGGPMVVNGILAGVVSYSFDGCAVGYPDVYTRVSAYVQWINDKIGGITN